MDQPQASPYHTSAEKHKYSQRRISLIDKTTVSFRNVSPEELADSLPAWLRRILLEHDTQAERILRERGDRRSVEFVSCHGLTKNSELMELMRNMMQQLQEAYGQSVDIEFTINLSEDGDFVVNLLQCRPLLVLPQDNAAGSLDDASGSGIHCPDEDCSILLETLRSSMGMSRSVPVDGIVYIDPVAYYQMPYADKSAVAKSLGAFNWLFRDQEKTLVLLTPGRIGTSSPELGVPTAFSDISSFSAICEIAESRAGYQPELSYGSHIFQDLVEADILYGAVFEDDRCVHFQPQLLSKLPNDITKAVPDADSSVIGYYDMTGRGCRLLQDMQKEHLLLYMKV